MDELREILAIPTHYWLLATAIFASVVMLPIGLHLIHASGDAPSEHQRSARIGAGAATTICSVGITIVMMLSRSCDADRFYWGQDGDVHHLTSDGKALRDVLSNALPDDPILKQRAQESGK
jgi:hypothetical protein